MEKPIFIGGAGSSGTTLLSILLNRHPEIACGPEMSFFNKKKIYTVEFSVMRRNFRRWLTGGLNTEGYWLYPGFFLNREYYGFSDEKIEAFLSGSSTLKEFIESFVDDYLRHTGKRRFAEKTPSNAYCFREILALFPKAKIVHLIRDGRDNYCSFKKKVPHPFIASSGWLFNVSAALTVRDHPNYFEARYEDFVSTPQRVLKQVCDHLEIEYSDQLFQESEVEKAETSRRGHEAWGNDPRGAISASSVGRHRKEMTPYDHSIFWNTALTNRAKRDLGADHTGIKDLMHLLDYPFSEKETAAVASIGLRCSVERIYLSRLYKALRLRRGWMHRYTKLIRR